MKYPHPCAPLRMTQDFGASPKVYAPLKGHPAEDYSFKWNEAIPFIADSLVYSKLNEDNKDPMKYTGVCTIVETGKNTADEIIYGHPNAMPVQIGLSYKLGETVALAGNKGFVMFNGREITKAEKLAGSTLGTHLHIQRRPCIKVKKTTKGKKYLETSKGKFKKDGFFYEVVNYQNGYNGCEDFEWNGKIALRSTSEKTFEEAEAELIKSGLPEPVLSMAKWVLRTKYGR